MTPFELRLAEVGDFTVLSPVGRLDTKTAPEMEKKAVELLKGGTRRFAIDFAATEYVSSAGLRVLLMLAKKLASDEGRLVLCALSPSVREVFEIAGFTSVFTIVPTLQEVVAAAPGRSRSEQLAERAAGALGVAAAPPPAPPADAALSALAARAARALGVNVPEAPPPAAPAPPAKEEPKKGWFRR